MFKAKHLRKKILTMLLVSYNNCFSPSGKTGFLRNLVSASHWREPQFGSQQFTTG